MPIHPLHINVIFAHNPKDWTEDFEHENGNYNCRCMVCNSFFTGHKRRVVCKVHATEEEKQISVNHQQTK